MQNKRNTMHLSKTAAASVAAACALAPLAPASIVAPMADTYLQSDGTQAIDTGYYANESTKVIIDFEPTQTNDTRYVFGAADPGSGLALSLKQAATGLTIQMSRDRNFTRSPCRRKHATRRHLTAPQAPPPSRSIPGRHLRRHAPLPSAPQLTRQRTASPLPFSHVVFQGDTVSRSLASYTQ